MFFLDETNSGRALLEAFVSAGFEAVRIVDIDELGRGCPDVVWLPFVGERGWLVVTGDHRMSRNPLELRALADGGVRMFCLPSRMRGSELAELCRRRAGAMERFAVGNPAPFVARVDSRGRIRMHYNRAKLIKHAST